MNFGHFFNDFGTVTALEARKMARRLSKQRARDRSQRASQKAELEEGLGRVALLTRSMAELFIAKGLITEKELLEQLRSTDFADGAKNGRLDPDVVMPGESKSADLEPIPQVTRSRRKSSDKDKGKGRGKRRNSTGTSRGSR